MSIGDNVRTLRAKMHVSQAWLAKEADISQGYLSQLESNDVRSPSILIVRSLSRALGISLLGLMDERPPLPSHLINPVLRTLVEELSAEQQLALLAFLQEVQH